MALIKEDSTNKAHTSNVEKRRTTRLLVTIRMRIRMGNDVSRESARPVRKSYVLIQRRRGLTGAACQSQHLTVISTALTTCKH